MPDILTGILMKIMLYMDIVPAARLIAMGFAG
jgi:hypothetical protein